MTDETAGLTAADVGHEKTDSARTCTIGQQKNKIQVILDSVLVNDTETPYELIERNNDFLTFGEVYYWLYFVFYYFYYFVL